ncbi:hypothetical protein KA093_02810 [Candidatus Saccharibacteria bacterium]|nr:hypothetical protein [Candidatus Saccharibacteria bacterium]
MDEPNSNTTPNTQSIPTTTSSVNNPVAKEKHSRAFSFVSVLFLLTLLGAGIMTYLWYNQKADVDQLNSEITSAKSSQTVLQAQIDKLKKQNANLGNAVVDTVANGNTSTDDEQIIAATKAYSHAQSSIGSASVSVNVNKKQGEFARSGVTVDNSYGFACVLKKADNIWIVIYCAQSATETTKQLNQQFAIPTAIINS